MKKLFVCIVLYVCLFGESYKDQDFLGINAIYDGQNVMFLTNPHGQAQPCLKTKQYDDARAEMLWVDRNHQNAIAEHVVISGNGMFIQSGWYLNNERTSLYRTLGTNTPQWTFPLANSGSYITVDATVSGDDIIVGTPGEPVYSFNYSSPAAQWTYSLPAGFAVAVSAQGPTAAISSDGVISGVLGRNESQGRLFIFDAVGDTIRSIGFELNSGIYGLDMASDGGVFCVTTYYAIYVFNLDGTRRDSIYNYGQTAAKISGNGAYLVRGSFNQTVYLYHWNGSSYSLVWQHNTGHPWVTSVAISEDGSTIMCGTFQYSPSYAGKVLMYDSSSATPLWEYNQYGDYVASCALSQDGSRGVAGSWGQLDATFGDVVTVFDKSSSTPILQILDDIDEPGSIFSVDISEDGSFVTAGGKAVHARQMGNGGEVYALRIIDSLTHDVGIDVINSPGSFLQVGQAVTPQVVVKNYGTQTETFNTYCMIYDSLAQLLYGDSIQISNLSPGANQTVDFSISWNVPSYGSYRTTAFTGLTNDEFLLNDTLIKHSICYHDGAVTSIDYPFAELTLHYTKHPRVHIANNGSYAENIPVNCEIKDQYNTLVYTGSGQAYLNPLQTSTITLDPAWAPADIGAYDVYVYTLLSEDYDPSNDTALTLTNITTEIMYDDGILDVYGYVSSNFYDNTFAEKMIPCLAAPYYIPSARVYVSNEDPVIVSLNLDSLGLPGLGPAYHIAAPETLSASGTGWLVKNFAPPLEMNNTDPFWFVVQWLSTSPNSPYIGMDNVTPRDSLSYWYWTESSNPGWHLWIFYDFMMRVMTAPEPGISEHNTQAQLRFNMFMPNPNPFVRTTTLHFTIPEPGILELNTYDVTGRLVKSSCQNITCPGEYDIMWQDIDKQGLSISSGVYFLKACFNERSATQKIILLRH